MEDIIGKALLDIYNGNEEPCFIRRDDGHSDVYNLNMLFSTFEFWRESEKQAMNFVGKSVLDIGCGAGRFPLFLQKKEIGVVAIDNSWLAIEISKKRGVKNSVLMSADELGFKQHFDTVLLMGNNFGLLGDVERTKKMLSEIYKITTGNAKIIAACIDPERETAPEDLRYFEENKNAGRLQGELRVFLEYKGEVSQPFKWLLLTPTEMKRMCEECGWKLEKIIAVDQNYIGIITKV